MPRYILAPEARDDLRDIRDHLAAEGGKRLARHVLGEFSAAFQLLASNPEAGFAPRRDIAAGEVLAGVLVRAILARERPGDPAS